MSKAIENLHAALERAFAGRPKIGGFPYLAETLSGGVPGSCDLSVIRKVTPQGIITTIAGNGTLGFSGDGGPATLAQLNCPGGIAFDGEGNLLFSDAGNYRIRKIVNGIITTVAGTGVSGYAGDDGPAIEDEARSG